MKTEVPTYEPDTRREDDDARQQRWDAFADTIREWVSLCGWQNVLRDLENAYAVREMHDVHGPGRFAWHVRQFADEEGWSSAVSALAQIMREEERFHRELMDRR